MSLPLTHSSRRVLAPDEEVENKPHTKHHSWVEGGREDGGSLPVGALECPVHASTIVASDEAHEHEQHNGSRHKSTTRSGTEHAEHGKDYMGWRQKEGEREEGEEGRTDRHKAFMHACCRT